MQSLSVIGSISHSLYPHEISMLFGEFGLFLCTVALCL